ncbi:MAG: dihydrolipoyl dehydrogenase [Planctomycetes bacterium]|nr:dihydrolipoyl dehydrogenase [Planctomycetota bacterium]
MPGLDLIVIGAGPGGYVAAIRAAQLGMSVACIEKEPQLGGTCLRVGCIPSKALLESSERYAEARHDFARHGITLSGVKLDLAQMMKRKDEVVAANTAGIEMLFKKNKIMRFVGHGRLTGKTAEGIAVSVEKAGGAPEALSAKNLILATGSRVASLPGVALDGDRIGTSTEALRYSAVPASLVVIGAGFIGLELGSVWSRLGTKVTVLEFLDRILPGIDAEVADAMLKILKKQGMEFRLKTRVTAARFDKKAGQCVVETADGEPIIAERVLVAVGRSPNTENLGLESVGIQPDPKGRIPVGDHFETSVAGIFAIGDVIRGPMLAHKAEDEGVACVEHMATGYGHVNYDVIPGIAYTHPEVASVGKTEEDLKAAQTPYRKGVFHFRGNGRARALNQTDGFVKVLAHGETDRVLGIHIVGPRAGDLIAEAAAAMEFGASSEDIARTCHAHPTLAEALKEAALAVDGRAIHS